MDSLYDGAVLEHADGGYETLRNDGEFVLYRARRRTLINGVLNATLVVTPVTEHIAPRSLHRIEHEYSLRAELDPAWAARPLALSAHQGHTVLVLEDPGGEPLDRLLNRPLDVTRFLQIAIPLTRALRGVHEQGLIHKNIKPANILVDIAAGGAWLTGFGIATRLPRELRGPEPPEVIAGTLAYMAPEQTGRMNRSIDCRSDLYALGVTFYEMLTGALPFTAIDPMGWVHCHIARRAVPPEELIKEIPPGLARIVMKLLAKTAEDRYQSAAGVEADLHGCLKQWQAHNRIDAFQLGTYDLSGRLLIPERLYGRDHEIETLLAAFERVATQGSTELALVCGYSGIGKSSVVNELHKALVRPRGLFAAGKFDQYKRDIPYATLAQAFQGLVRSLLGQSEAELGPWRDALREALGGHGQLIVNLVPELELVIGIQPPVPELPPQDAKNRFQMAFCRFLSVFAHQKHPLVLFLDDLQWLDSATLELLEHLVMHSQVRHLFLVGAYRDNEVSCTHPLTRTLEVIRRADTTKVHEIVLMPLRLDDVCQFVADALHCGLERARPLAHLVHEKTGGNPFFAIQFFTALAEEALLAFNPSAPAWQWDMDRIRAKSYTDNVVDLMAGKLKRFCAATQEALMQLACLGNVAGIATVARVHGETEEAMHAALWEAVHAGLVSQQDSAYKFLHDRIQQAAYSLIPQEQRAAVHLALGRALLASMPTDKLTAHLFDVANQFNRCAALLLDREEKARVADINLCAGRRAKAAAAFVSACVYLAAGMTLLDEKDWSERYELTFGLWLARAECEFLTGNFETAEQLIGELLQRGASKVDQAAAYHLKVQLHVVKSENPQAVDSALTCLRLFGIDIPAHPSREQVQAEYETVWRNLQGRPIEGLADLPLMQDPQLQAAMRVLSVLSDPAYVTDRNLFGLQQCRMVNLSLRHGISGPSAHACAYLGFSLGPAFQRYPEGFRLAKVGCELVEKHGFLAYQAKVQDATGIAAFWTQPMATAIDFIRASIRTAIGTGDLTYGCYSMYHIVTLLLLRNDPLDAVWHESQIALNFVHKARFRDVEDIIVAQRRFIATMQGRTATFSTFNDAQFEEAAFETQLLMGNRMPTMICWYWITKTKARFLSGDYAEALASADKAKALLWSSTAHFPLLDYYYYTALTVAALYEQACADERDGWRDRLTAYQTQLREWAETYPPTFSDKHALVSAEIARLEGQIPEAMHLYEQAIRSARENGFIQNEALANELAAQFYAARGFEKIALVYLRDARYWYLRWGAEAKVRQLEQFHPQLREQSSPEYTTTFDAPVKQLEVGTVVKASQAVSSEIVLDRLIETLMRIAVEHAGANRGLLIHFGSGAPRIDAEATTGRGRIEVTLRQAAVTPCELPESVLHYAIRTRESVILDDAAAQNPFSADEYIRQKRARSVLCLPLVKQAELIGMLYLENNLASHVFTPVRICVLKLLSSQAAISIENARLYAELINENRNRQCAEEALSKAQAELAHVTRVTALGELAASIAHEINQPLGAIVAYANAGLNWLAAGQPDIASTRESLAEIVKDGQRAADVLTRIRTLLARSSPAHEPCKLADLVRDVLALVRADLARHAVSIQTSLPASLPLVLADRVQLQQVLLNLLLNAAEASRDLPPERRRLLVCASIQDDDDGHWVVVAVRDAGVGLRDNDVERLFEAFYTTKPNGLGMGLSISRSIIGAHGGRLWATANQGPGATFQFALPSLDEPCHERASQVSRSNPGAAIAHQVQATMTAAATSPSPAADCSSTR